MSKTATYNNFTFSYENMIIQEIDTNEHCLVFSNVTVLESKNPKFKKGDQIEQITASITLHFEHEDGTEY